MSIRKARAIVDRLDSAGAKHCQLVGGYVRDRMLGIESKDIDIEVYGINYIDIVDALESDFRIDVVGQSFGVIKVDNEIDISLPRRESKMGIGHRGFMIITDPGLTREDAAARRDFTINAISMDFDGNIFDPFGGCSDLKKGVLRATTEAFREDPLRVLRGMQFAARFGFDLEGNTIDLCRELANEFQHLASERVWDEWYKWAAKGRHPSKGLQVLKDTCWLEHFPVLKMMTDTPQDPGWHPEGDVFAHTGYVCDVAYEVAEREDFTEKERVVLMFAALCHDFGKPHTTVKNDESRWVAPGHAAAGAASTEQFLDSMKAPGWVGETVVPLVANHMAHVSYTDDERPSDRAVRRLANRLSPANIRLWSALVEADASGRPPKPKKNPVAEWVGVAESLAVSDSKPNPILLGRHLIPLGYKPGPDLGTILKAAFEAQLDGEFDCLERAIEWAKCNYPNERDA